MAYHYVVVGAGFAGCVLAERLASQRDKKILLIDRRNHIAGNAYDSYNEEGILIHNYGPHVFHTNDERVYRYLSQFTAWRQYEHRVLSSVNGKLVPIPINRNTLNTLLGLHLQTQNDVELFFNSEKVAYNEITNSEEFVTSRIGKRLFGLLYEGYTRKQWGIEPKELAPSVCGRIPIRTNTDDRYFEDTFQSIPAEGYTKMFEKIIAHPNIHLSLKTGFNDVPSSNFDKVIYTGPIDEFFQYLYGTLPYRSLKFEHEIIHKEFFQSAASINFPNEFDYTRISEWKYITGQKHSHTAITREYPQAEGEPYYPIPSAKNEQQYQRYEKETTKLKTVYFVGRLATYRYYNMDQVTAQALKTFEKIYEK